MSHIALPGIGRLGESHGQRLLQQGIHLYIWNRTGHRSHTLLSEFRSGTWSRSFRFPHSLDRDQLKARYRDGILEINAGKAVEHTSVSVKIDS